MILFVAIVLAMLSLYLVVSAFQPLTEGEIMTVEEWERLEDETLNLLERRDRVFEEIRELEFESATNKVEPDEFERLRRKYEDQALEIMEKLQVEFDAYGSRIEADTSAIIEAAKRRRDGTQSAASTEPAPTEQAPQPSAEVAVEVEVGHAPIGQINCHACHEQIPADSRFCDTCGAAQLIKCSACSTLNRPDAKFCKGCGQSIGGED